jgi:hypothetical protein
MTSSFEKIATAALELPVKGRAKLAEKLLRSLDAPNEAEIERLWVDEAEKRYQKNRQGKTKLVDGARALARLKAR